MAIETQEDSISSIVRDAEQNFINGTTLKSKYVSDSLYEDINKIEAYLNSKHITGETDSMGRDKPFFNIVTASKNIWYRATDIDRKNIKIKATKSSDLLGTFMATIHLQDWMRRNNFGKFLNDWGMDLAGYNSSVVKFVKKNGELIPMVVPWTRLIVDSVDFASNPKIEILELTEAQLYQREGYDKEVVEALCDTVKARETVGGQNKDNKNQYIKLYEIHGLLPKSLLTHKDADDDIYVQQMHVISFVAGKGKGEYDDFTLVKGQEEKDPYMLTCLLPETDGSINLKGSVKTLFDAQWMLNHTVKSIKDQLDLASKLIFQTSDGNFVGQNALSAIETGDILIHAPNQPLTQLANSSHDITSLQNFGNQWKALAQEITSTPDAMMGNTAPSGTAWRQVEALQQEAHSLFELMTENKGLAIEDMMREFVIPFLKTKMNTADEIGATLEDYDIKKIDAKFVKYMATKKTNKEVVDQAIKFLSGEGEAPTPETQALAQAKNEQEVQSNLDEMGNQRFFVPSEVSDMKWKDIFKDLEWEVEVDVTGEASFNKEDLATLSTVLQTIGSNPTILQDPNAKLIFNKILEKTGAISPLEIQSTPKAPPMPSQTQPQQAPPSALGGGLQA